MDGLRKAVSVALGPLLKAVEEQILGALLVNTQEAHVFAMGMSHRDVVVQIQTGEAQWHKLCLYQNLKHQHKNIKERQL